MKGFFLGTQNKTFLNANKDVLVMLIRVGPYLGLGFLALLVGFKLAGLLPMITRMYVQIAFLGLLLGLIILDQERGWNLVLFILFGIAAGAVFFHWSPDSPQANSWILFIVLLIISMVGGSLIREAGGRAAGVLFISSIFYMMGWIFFAIIQLPEFIVMIWTILGVVLFTFIAIAVISQGIKLKKEVSSIPLSIQLFVVLFNLCWLTGLL